MQSIVSFWSNIPIVGDSCLFVLLIIFPSLAVIFLLPGGDSRFERLAFLLNVLFHTNRISFGRNNWRKDFEVLKLEAVPPNGPGTKTAFLLDPKKIDWVAVPWWR